MSTARPPSHDVDCPRCGAKSGDSCKTRNGSVRRSRPHLERKQAWARNRSEQ